MADLRVPLASPRPDCEAFIAALMGRTCPARPPLIEYLVDTALMRPILTEMLGRQWVDPTPGDREAQAR